MKRFPSNCILLVSVLTAASCSDEAAEERREFQKLEAAIGMVADASREDRGIRLEQLEATAVRFERLEKLKSICISSYRAFENAAGLLALARNATTAAEAVVAEADRKKTEFGTLTPEEEANMLMVGKKATESLKAVTGELSAAEKLVADCREKRNDLRYELTGPR